MKKLLTLFILSLCLGVNARAQELPAIKKEFEYRVSTAVSAEFFDKKLGVDFSTEVRFAEPFKYDQTLLKLGVDYDVKGWFKVGVGGRLIFNETKEGTKTQGRFDADISRSFKLGKFRLIPRVRFCNYQENGNDIYYNEKAYMLRGRLVLGYKYAKKAIFEPVIGAELYYNIRYSVISSVRYSIGGDFRLDKHSHIGIRYLLDTEFKTRINTNIIEVGYEFKF